MLCIKLSKSEFQKDFPPGGQTATPGDFQQRSKKMNHASLFSGIGGAEVAASMMGWQNLFHCEIQEFPRKVLDYWFPNSESYEDITKTNFQKWHGKVDVLTGGFPCQPFSVAGKRKGADDNRYLWPQMLRAIRQIQPTWVVGENVAGIKTMVEPGQEIKMGRTDNLFEENYLYREESRFTLEKICQDLEAAGYTVQPFNIPACSVGAPHRRERVWIVAHRADAGSQTMQPKRQDRVPAPGSPSHAHRTRQGRRPHKPQPIARSRPTSNLGISRKKRALANTSSQKENFWKDFPTQSPICRGNDGIPFNVDRLTISFARWRTESIKAYGNAWVPQVAYQIFQAIQAQEEGR